TIEGNTVTIVEAGEIEIESSTVGDNNYQGASKTIAFTVKKASQNIDFNSLNDVVYQAGKEIQLTAESDQGLPITFLVKEGAVDLEGQSLKVRKAGLVTIEANQAGNENILVASVLQSFEVNKAPQTIIFSEIEDKVASDAPFNLVATSSADIPVKFTLISGNAILDGNQVTITGNGEITIEAYNDGNENYLAERKRQSFVVAEPSKQNQVVTLAALPDTVTVDQVVTLDITVSSGLNPDVDVVGSALRNEQSLTFTQAGEVTLAIGQPGNDEYNPARTVSHTFVVVTPSEIESPLGTNTQKITYQLPDNPVFGESPFALAVESSSSLPLVYEIDGPAEISEGMLTITGAGEVKVRAFQLGNDQYAPSDTIEFSFTVRKAPQAITLEVIPVGDNTFQVKAISNSALPVVVTVSEGEGTLEEGILTVNSSKVIIIASQEGDDNYTAAEPITQELAIELITSIGDELTESGIIIYPNPGNGLFSVRIKKERESVPFQVFDLRGAMVIQGKLQSVQPTIDLTNQRSGTYFLQMQLPNNTKQHRLIKQ
ncbi:MAG: T9SS type A sorting domain-containing protein, partial [Tunicatimonas sp.]|uniref:T9SS type A sorting domain-containing protein n=1 Tax=Tunicatimonas sp. TaxID=1940096 RepID=UPI003C789B1F